MAMVEMSNKALIIKLLNINLYQEQIMFKSFYIQFSFLIFLLKYVQNNLNE